MNIFLSYESGSFLKTISFHNIFKHHFFKKPTEPALPELFPQRVFCFTFPLCSGFLLFLPSLFSLVTTWDAHFSAFGCMLILHIYKHVAGTTLFFFFYKNEILFYRLCRVFFFSSSNLWKSLPVPWCESNSFPFSGCIISHGENVPQFVQYFLLIGTHFCLFLLSQCSHKHP